MEPTLNTTWTLIIAVVVLYVGHYLTQHLSLPRTYNIPEAVSGGLLCSLVIGIPFWSGVGKFQFDLTMRDTLLLIFFSTIGLSAKFHTLKSGGRLSHL